MMVDNVLRLPDAQLHIRTWGSHDHFHCLGVMQVIATLTESLPYGTPGVRLIFAAPQISRALIWHRADIQSSG